ncbi:TIGR01459 family HAD-type hydrolase [Rhodobacter sphaeroides]|jgi:HAD superfamily hydrolase (TIGR01459 family)|uniref:HAD superfamily protein n=1 Tax=Cereibacter sphaeroides (strain ATCC 17023 / DSM 158 / JCM 6121 / CCUG 31486 / LMG 2827 / NBRC 12203 / NCIMB 8253 / ATH 2.4.1.) TaxID=272943 RepID=Q3J424_CERS4|nr:TIGR01459 family HAD-type hydrolase [Cereibacter sphaeroides]ABA78460.1 putative HAD superfamily protein [Cereibacter sphaeroides 2.4.1]AMJ46813.1 HAD family hydrolase [Cereibacter sphaeroides]ANS33526.1 HAD family hydrolase [Cereibacter sphaeroides]ATN62569.1 HAD family hydrolase [Cereibacter sphaeroides]AXC60683.1 TIGR01459 family HAD-type hydrolase [Cereibacter sphaeroides 2.4.1]
MTRIIASLSEVSAGYSALFCDLWGCLHDGKRPFAEAVEALRAFRARGGTVLLMTNAPRPKPSVVRQLESIGVPPDCYDEVTSSGDAAQYALVTGAVGRRVYHLGPQKDETFFTELSPDLQKVAATEAPIVRVPLEEAEGIVCTGLFDDLTETPEDYRATLLYAKTQGLKLLCANPDIVVDFGDKRIYCAGAIAEAYDAMGGQSLYFGKPHPPIYDLARRRLEALRPGVPADEILCVGDGIATDIRGAVAEGLDSLFITGGLAASVFGENGESLDQDRLEHWLAEAELSPTLTIARLR